MIFRRFRFCALWAQVLLIFGISSFCEAQLNAAQTLSPPVQAKLQRQLAQLLVPFVPNQGQAQKDVAFYADAFWGKALISRHGKLGYLIPKEKGQPVFLVESLVGGKAEQISGEGKLSTKINYFRSGQTVRHLPAYQRVSLGKVYPGVEFSIQTSGSSVEKIFQVAPSGDPKAIRLRLEGAKRLSVNAQGELEAETAAGKVVFSKPIAYQERQGRRQEVQVAYRLKGQNKYGFVLGTYDRTQPLTIDPILAQAHVGGSGSSSTGGLAVDAQGNVYVAGITYASDALVFPGPYNPNGFDTNLNGRSDVFILKLDPDLTTMLVGTYFGGGNYDYLGGMTLDGQGNVYIVGHGYSTDIPTTATAYKRTGTNLFIAKFDPDLGTLLASTYFGSTKGYNLAGAVAVDRASGDVIVAGMAGSIGVLGKSASTDFPTTPGAFDTTFSGSCYSAGYKKVSCSTPAFVSRLDSNLTQLKASTFLDGKGSEYVRALAIGSDGDIYVAGSTTSSDFPVTGAGYDKTYGGAPFSGYSAVLFGTVYRLPNTEGDVFVARLSPDLAALKASTFLGGSYREVPVSLILDAFENVFVSGWTESSNFPATSGAFDTIPGVTGQYTYDGFVTKLDGGLTTLLASTFLGAGGNDFANGMALDPSGNVLVVGSTRSGNFFVPSPTATSTDQAFIARLEDSFLGLIEGEVLVPAPAGFNRVALEPSGTPYAAGYIGSSGWVVKLGSVDLAVTLTDAPDPVATGETLHYSVGITNNGPNPATNVALDFTLPDVNHFTFVSATSSQGNCNFTGTALHCDLGTLGVGANAAVQVVVTPTQGGTFIMGVQASASEPDRDPTNNSASTTTTVTGGNAGGGNTGGGGQGGGGGGSGTADLSVSATDAPDPAPFNAPVTYDLTVSNQGPDAATNVVLTQAFGNSFVLEAATVSQGSCNLSGMTVSCSVGNLASGASANAQITVRFVGDGGMTSDVSATAQESDPNPENNNVQVETEVLAN